MLIFTILIKFLLVEDKIGENYIMDFHREPVLQVPYVVSQEVSLLCQSKLFLHKILKL